MHKLCYCELFSNFEGDSDHESMIQLERRLQTIDECDEHVTDDNVADWILQLADSSSTDCSVGAVDKIVAVENAIAAESANAQHHISPSTCINRKQVLLADLKKK